MDGAEGSIALGGNRILAETGGYYIEPTIIAGVEENNSLAKEEIFGPLLTVTSFDSDADAIRIANSTELGLAAGVWTANLSRAHTMISAIKAGVVHVNTYGGADNTVPLGGFKQSGNGHDKSLHAIDKFINKKTGWIKL